MSDDNIPTKEPTELIASTTWQWKRTDLSDYPASEWTLKYTYLLNTGTTTFSITASADDDDFLVSEVPADTGQTPGDYLWQAVVTEIADATNEFAVDRGCLEVLQNFEDTVTDPRSHVQKVYDALKSVIEGRASRDVMKTEINGKKVERMSWDEVLGAYNHFKNLANTECIKASNADTPNALASSRMIRHTMGNPS
jgi:hypothetical protein